MVFSSPTTDKRIGVPSLSQKALAKMATGGKGRCARFQTRLELGQAFTHPDLEREREERRDKRDRGDNRDRGETEKRQRDRSREIDRERDRDREKYTSRAPIIIHHKAGLYPKTLENRFFHITPYARPVRHCVSITLVTYGCPGLSRAVYTPFQGRT